MAGWIRTSFATESTEGHEKIKSKYVISRKSFATEAHGNTRKKRQKNTNGHGIHGSEKIKELFSAPRRQRVHREIP